MFPFNFVSFFYFQENCFLRKTDFGINFVFINQIIQSGKPKVPMQIKVLGISFRGCVAKNFRGGAIGDWVACRISVRPKINYY